MKNTAALTVIGVWIAAAFCGQAATAAEVTAQPVKAEADKPLQFTDLGGVRSWKAGGAAVVFVRSKDDQWYKADLAEPCMSFNASKGINFLTETEPETNSRVSKVVVDRHICTVTALTKIDAPPTAKQ